MRNSVILEKGGRKSILSMLIEHTHSIDGNRKPSLLEVHDDDLRRYRHLHLLCDINKIHAQQRDMYGGGLVIIRRTNYVPSENDTIIVTLERVQRYRFIISLKDGGTFDSPRIDGAESEQVKSCLVLSCLVTKRKFVKMYSKEGTKQWIKN